MEKNGQKQSYVNPGKSTSMTSHKTIRELQDSLSLKDSACMYIVREVWPSNGRKGRDIEIIQYRELYTIENIHTYL